MHRIVYKPPALLAIKQSEAKNMLVSIKSGIPAVKHQRPKVDLSFLLKLKQTSSEVSIAQLRRIMRVIAPVVSLLSHHIMNNVKLCLGTYLKYNRLSLKEQERRNLVVER